MLGLKVNKFNFKLLSLPLFYNKKDMANISTNNSQHNFNQYSYHSISETRYFSTKLKKIFAQGDRYLPSK